MPASMAATALAMSPFAVAGRLAAPRSPPPATAMALRRRALVVRAQASNDDNEATEMDPTTETKASANFAPTLNSSTSSSPPNPKPMALSEAMAFSGPAPERVNGRAAMVGFVAALAVEASRGGGLLSQAGSSAGLAWLAATAAVLSVASLVPLLRRGETAERRGSGDGVLMSADAELWNGRFAMLGIVALAFTEYLTGAPLVNV